MEHLAAITVFVAVSVTPDAALASAGPTETELRAAVSKALPLIQKGAAGHRAQRTCFACHHQGVPVFALVSARSRGFAVDEDDLDAHRKFIVEFLDKNREQYGKGRGQGGQASTAGYALWTLEMGGAQPDETTTAVAEYLLLFQQNLGHWRMTSDRPPSETSHFSASYFALRGMQTFASPEQSARAQERVRQVRAWLLRTPARDTEDRVFRLWALRQAGAHPVEVQRAAQELIRTQRQGGGWAQLETMAPDAYATGTALVVLHEAAGLRTNDTVYQRGVRYLLETQGDDGSWHVRSRSRPFQTYFESGFPHGKDQFISLAASSWAAAALVLGCPLRP